jgi:uncharacterized membrane protein
LPVFIILGGVSHFLQPEMFQAFIPEFLPQQIINYISGFIEIIVGLAYFYKPTRLLSAQTIFIMMIVFLPLHVIDVFKEFPAIGSKTAAYIRLPIQFLLIYLAWKVFKFNKK